MRSRPGIVSPNFDLANGVGPGIEQMPGIMVAVCGRVRARRSRWPRRVPDPVRRFSRRRNLPFSHSFSWVVRPVFHGCDGSFPRTRAPVPATGSGEPLGTDAEPGPSLSDGLRGPSHPRRLLSYTKSGKFAALLFHGLCRLGKIDWASESHQELDRCLSRTITASKNFND